MIIVSEAVIIVSNGIEDFLHPHNKFNSRPFVFVLNIWLVLFLYVWTITLNGKDREKYLFITFCFVFPVPGPKYGKSGNEVLRFVNGDQR